MREIKFRAWDKENEAMVYPKGILFDGRVVYFSCGTLEPHEGYELMQYTGLKDKNGREIYEGDVILFNNFGDTLDKVVYSQGCFRTSRGGYLLDKIREIEIIGNIYEYPELWEGKK